jgi:23S rRNA (pseudouridine1915-N3)-methyltransferase
MRIKFLWIGRTKDYNLSQLIREYSSRIRHFLQLSVIEIKPGEGRDPKQVLDKEGDRLLEKLAADDYIVLLDSEGKGLTSEEFARMIAGLRDRSVKSLVFVLGGHYGVSERVKSQAHQRVSLSRMTLTHELARVFLLEQVYRALTVIHRVPYHK